MRIGNVFILNDYKHFFNTRYTNIDRNLWVRNSPRGLKSGVDQW